MIETLELWRINDAGRRVAVPLAGLRQEALTAIDAARRILGQRGVKSLRVSSTVDGLHHRESFHYIGLAIDMARDDIPAGGGSELAEYLGPSYQLIIGETHFHVEFDPRGIIHRARRTER